MAERIITKEGIKNLYQTKGRDGYSMLSCTKEFLDGAWTKYTAVGECYPSVMANLTVKKYDDDAIVLISDQYDMPDDDGKFITVVDKFLCSDEFRDYFKL